jgi:regulatory protein
VYARPEQTIFKDEPIKVVFLLFIARRRFQLSRAFCFSFCYNVSSNINTKHMDSEERKVEAMKFAMKLIGLRLRAEKELRTRLAEKGYPSALAEEVIAEMKRYGYIDDAQFAESFIGDRIRFRPVGRFIICMELKSKGLREDLIEEKLAELYPLEDEQRAAARLAEKKLKTLGRLESNKARLKLLNFLKAKGFSSEIISQALKNNIDLD